MTPDIRPDEPLDERYGTLWSGRGDGPEPSTVAFLADHREASPSERLDVLLADHLLRWRCDRPKEIGAYLAEHPWIADDPEAILKLVQGEFLARLDRGEAPEPESYARMFPALDREIRAQCEVDRWLTMPDLAMATTADYPVAGRADRDDDDTDDGVRPTPAADHPVDLEAPLPGADFELVRPLGVGGMGEVHEAIQKSLRKRVALKLIHREALDSPSRVRRFLAEGRALARLRHPHIVGVHGIGRMADGRYFLVMDLVEGGTTLATLLRQGTISFERAAGLVATVAEAIEHAHSRGVIHRDLKPSNVLLGAGGEPLVTDFGLAKVFDAADPDNPQTTADRILGTPHYMAPEQADPARGPITPRTDVYALGGLLFALLTGRPPIQGDSITAILTRVISPEPVPTPRASRADAPVALERICLSCLEKDAEKRPPSAAAVAGALREWLADPAIDGPAIAAFASPDPDAGRTRSGWATDRSMKDGGRTPNPGRWPARATRSAGSRRSLWAAGAVASALALLLISIPAFQAHIARDRAPMPRPGDPVRRISDSDPRVAPSVLEPPKIAAIPSAIGKKARIRSNKSSGLPAAAPEAPTQTVVSAAYIAPAPRRLRPEDRQRLGLPPDFVDRWEVHVYRPQYPSGQDTLDLGDMRETPIPIQLGDLLYVKARFREPVHAVVVVIRPDGSVRRFGAPADAAAGRPAAEPSITPGVDKIIPTKDPGPTVLVLLALRPLLASPAAAGAGAIVGALGPAPDPSAAGLTRSLVWAFQTNAPGTGLAGRTWVFDGQAIVPVPITPMIEEAAGPRAFAAIASMLQTSPALNGARAVFFEVAPPK